MSFWCPFLITEYTNSTELLWCHKLPGPFKMSTRMSILLKTFTDVVGLANIDHSHILSFQNACWLVVVVVCRIQYIRRRCNSKLINSWPKMVTWEVMEMVSVYSFLPWSMFNPIRRPNQYLRPKTISFSAQKRWTLKVDVPKSNIAITWTPIFEWKVVRCGSKNGQLKDISWIEIGLGAQNMLAILGAVVNMIGKTYMTNVHKNLHFDKT